MVKPVNNKAYIGCISFFKTNPLPLLAIVVNFNYIFTHKSSLTCLCKHTQQSAIAIYNLITFSTQNPLSDNANGKTTLDFLLLKVTPCTK